MMKKKVWLVLLAMVLVSGLVMFGCGGSKDDDDDDDDDGDFVAFSFEGPWDDVIKPWGNSAPTVSGNEVAITANGTADSASTGFFINFEDIGYTYNAADLLIFTYEIEVTTPEAVITLKNPKNWGNETTAPSDWGKGKGREYALGNTTWSNYEGPLVNATWDGTTGTFEVLMSVIKNATAVGFQHNAYADFGGDGVRIAEHSVYTLKITKIKNAVSTIEPPPPPPPPVEGEGWDDTEGMTTGIAVQGSATFADGIISLGKGIDNSSSLFTLELPEPTNADGTKEIKIRYICKIEAGENEIAPIILKNGAWGDPPNITGSGANQYPRLTPDAITVLQIPEKIYADETETISFQCNDGDAGNDAIFKIKIISVTME